MPSDAKKAIFDSIRASLAASRPHDAERAKSAHHHGAAGDVDFARSPSRPEVPKEMLIATLRDSLEFVGANFYAVYDEAEAATVVESLIAERGAETVAFSDSPLVGRVVKSIEDAATFVGNAASDELFETDMGITSAQFAIAETGTLVLENGRERNRLTSLVPPVHVCVIEAQQVRQTLGETLELLQRDQSRAITFITGASRTSDIELTLAIGVHGPGELHVVLIDA